MFERLRSLQQRRTWNWLALALILVSLLLMVATVLSINHTGRSSGDHLRLTASRNNLERGGSTAEKRLQRSEPPLASELADDRLRLKETPLKMTVGLYAMNNYALDLKVPSFRGTGYAWFKWNPQAQTYFEQRGLKVWKVIAPINLLNIPNGSGSVFQPIGEDKPILMPDGDYYQLVSYKGEFYIDRGDFSRHPFPQVSLPIILEADDINLDFTVLRLQPDTQSSGIGEFIASNSSWLATG